MAKRMSREARKRLILRTVRDFQTRGQYACTAHDLAKEMGVSPSSHLNGILIEMCDDAVLDCEPKVYRGIAKVKFMYSLA